MNEFAQISAMMEAVDEEDQKPRKKRALSRNTDMEVKSAITVNDSVIEMYKKNGKLTDDEKEVICRAFVEEYEEAEMGPCLKIIGEEWEGRYVAYITEKRGRKSYKPKYKTIADFYDICEKHGVPVPDIRIPGVFWTVNYSKKLDSHYLVFNLHKLTSFLNYHGFYKFFQDDMTYKFCRSVENKVKEVPSVKIKEFVVKFIEGLPTIVAQKGKVTFTKHDLLEALKNQTGRLFSNDLMETLNNIYPDDFFDRKADSAFFFFKNVFVMVTDDGWKSYPLTKLKKLIWEEQIVDKDFNMPKEGGDACVFRRFIANVCKTVSSSSVVDREKMLMTIMGYLLHDYQEGKRKAIAFTDEASTDDAPNGRSGKSLLSEAIGHLRVVTAIDGKNFTYSDGFKWQEVGYDTQIICIDDAKRRFKIEDLFHNITQGVSINKKRLSSFKIRPKFIITINSVVAGEGGSVEDRLIEFAFSDHYHAGYGPNDEFGHWFFKDWNDDEWDRFYAFMMDCCGMYFRQLRDNPMSMGIFSVKNDRLAARHIESKIDQDFLEFMSFFEKGELVDGLYKITFDEKIEKKVFYAKFIEYYPDHRDRIVKTTTRKVTYWLKEWCEYKGYGYSESNSGSRFCYEISRTKQDPFDVSDITKKDDSDIPDWLIDEKDNLPF